MDVNEAEPHARTSRLAIWAARMPIGLSLGLLIGWMLVGGVAAGLWTVASGESITDDVPQFVARIAASALVLALLWRARWLRTAGVARIGPFRAWLITLVALAYLVPTDVYALFGQDGLSRLGSALGAEFPRLWVIQASVGSAEELLFRGLLLAVLAAAWGRTGRGGLGAAAGAAVLFAVPHLIAIAAAEPATAILNALDAFLSGWWYGALVLAYGSIWPVVLMHAGTNLAALSIPISADAGGYVRLIVADLPWVLFGAWLLLRPTAARSRTLSPG